MNRRAITDNVSQIISIVVLFVIATGLSYYILQEQRLRIPVLEEKPFELKAEFETAQAVVPGQGQTVRVAGVRIGDVQQVELEDGIGVVTFAIDPEFTPVYRDATVLMRPTTGLKDMFFDLDPGTQESGEFAEGDRIPLANTAPDVNLDEILAALDADTRSYLRLLLVGAGKGLEGRGEDLGKLLGSLGPINRDLGALNKQVAKRRVDMANLIHSFNVLTTRVGQAEGELTRLVSSSRQALGTIAERDPDLRRAIALLPGTLEQAETTLTNLSAFAQVMGPAFNDLRPFARNLDELNASNVALAEAATPALRDQIRPFVRTARKSIPDLRLAADRFGRASPRLTVLSSKLNRLFNMAARNPGGAEPSGTPGRNEGYLYWFSWLGHNSTSAFSAADGNGFYRKVYLTMGCAQARELIAAPTPELGALTQLVTGFTDPLLDSLGCE